MRLLLDTQAFLYAGLGAVEKFPTRAAKAVGDDTSEFFISVISLFELEVLIRKGRFNTTPAKIEAGLKLLDAKVLPFATPHVMRTFTLPAHHPDPFDRMIIATALVEDMHLVGGDEQFLKYKGLKVLWR
jgi:PIN domain nuclease of toxin-antitoxin system